VVVGGFNTNVNNGSHECCRFIHGILSWILTYPLAIHAGKRYLGGKYEYAVNLVSAIAIMGFAAYFIYMSLNLLTNTVLP